MNFSNSWNSLSRSMWPPRARRSFSDDEVRARTTRNATEFVRESLATFRFDVKRCVALVCPNMRTGHTRAGGSFKWNKKNVTKNASFCNRQSLSQHSVSETKLATQDDDDDDEGATQSSTMLSFWERVPVVEKLPWTWFMDVLLMDMGPNNSGWFSQFALWHKHTLGIHTELICCGIDRKKKTEF